MEVNNLKKNTFVREVYGGNVKYEDIKDGEFAADFQTFIGKDVYNLIRHLDFPENSVPLS